MKTIELLNPWWASTNVELGIERTGYLAQIDQKIKNPQILFLLGSRRVGKTRILLQYVYRLIKSGLPPKKILFLSLDNSNLENFDWFSYISQSDFQFVVLDEVHSFPKWAQILKSLYDLPGRQFKLLCSGSSSRAIEDNKAYLTGRGSNIFVSPLDFNEFKQFSTSENYLADYLCFGGYPEFVLEREPNYLNELVQDIVEKDIVKIHKVRNRQYFLDICQIMAKQIGYKSSANKVANVLGIDNKSVDHYIQYLKEVKLIDSIYQFTPSANKRLYAPKKYYYHDLGMRNSFVGFSDIGSLAENAIYLKLVKTHGNKNIFYLNDDLGNEVDFVITLGDSRVFLVESKYNNLQSSVVNSLSKVFYKEIHGKEITDRIVVTDGVDSTYQKGDVKIQMISLEKFLG